MRNFNVWILAILLSFSGLVTISQPATAGTDMQDDILAQGKYIAAIAGCASCHTPDKAEYQNPQTLTIDQIRTLTFDGDKALDADKLFAGGRAFDLGPAGIVFARNITPDNDTGLGTWTDEQVKIAIKSGADEEGKTLFPVMPYHVYSGMADSDLEAVVAYLRSIKAIKNETPAKTVNTEGMPTLPYNTGITAPDPSDKAARGAYLVNSIMACTDCHTPVDPATGAPVMEKYLAGRQPYEGPWGIVYGGNITPDKETGLGNWTDEEMKRALLAGISKDGRRLILMPWYAYSALTPEDANAVVYFLKNELPAVKNEVPAPSLNPDFMVTATESDLPKSAPAIPASVLVIVGVLIIVAVTLGMMYIRRKSG